MPVEINDEVKVKGLIGTCVVEDILDGVATIRPFAEIGSEDDLDPDQREEFRRVYANAKPPNPKYKPGDRVYFYETHKIPVDQLVVVGKHHQRPPFFHMM